MSETPTPQPESVDPANTPGERQWFVPTLLASAAATAALNGYIAVDDDVRLPRLTVVDTRFEDTDIQTAPDGTPYLEDRDRRIAHSDLRQLTQEVRGEWARLFDADPATGKFNPDDYEQLVSTVRQLGASGFSRVTLEVTGHASAEDDTVVDGFRTGGFTADNEANRRTAAKRAAALAALLDNEPAIQAAGMDVTVVEGSPVEHRLSEREAALLDTVATEYGYVSAVRMTEVWNRDPQTVPPEVKSTLDAILGTDRFVRATVLAATGTATETVCVIPLREITEHNTGGDRDVMPIPLPLIIPAFIRRRERQPKPDKPVAVAPVPAVAPPRPVTTPPAATGGTAGGAGAPGCLPFLFPGLASRLPEMHLPNPRLLLVPLLGLVAVGANAWNNAEIDIDDCFYDISKAKDDWIPGISFHWNTCDVPPVDPGGYDAVPAPDPCLGADRREERVTSREYRELVNGRVVSSSPVTE